jgi:hypothetical protein
MTIHEGIPERRRRSCEAARDAIAEMRCSQSLRPAMSGPGE